MERSVSFGAVFKLLLAPPLPEYIQAIMGMDQDVQHVVMGAIQQVCSY